MTIQEILSAAEQLSLSDQVQLASQLMQTAIQKLQVSAQEQSPSPETKEDVLTEDPLVGLFAGSPDLATRSKEILKQDVDAVSGFTWKKS